MEKILYIAVTSPTNLISHTGLGTAQKKLPYSPHQYPKHNP